MFGAVETVEVLEKAVRVDAELASDDDLLESVGGLARARGLLDAVEAHVLAELDSREFCDREFGLATGTWLARETGVPMAVGHQRVKVASTLRSHLDEVDDALVDGRVSWEHARVLARACQPRVADRVAAIQSTLVGLVGGASFEQWRREATAIVEMLDEDG
jgi:hypothetical protein